MNFKYINTVLLSVLVYLSSVSTVWAHPGHGLDAYWHHLKDGAPLLLALIAFVLLIRLNKAQ